ncbi:MAG: UDP-glucose 4-epimerase [Solirubrobacterales bacterium]|jgi:UDP-glucose 4-epimerase|nr:UDP-glucose 4-epimerase [Solirubrobacterales bacterium]
MHHLVTGGAGFIGSHLTDALVARGDTVTVLDDLSTGRINNLQLALSTGNVEFVEGSTSDAALVNDLIARADSCFHLASAVGVQLIVDEAYDSLIKNVRGCDVVMHAAANHDVPLVFSSTSEIYGKNSEGALAEDSDRLLGPPQRSRWSYATAKAFGESLAFGLCNDRGAPIKVVRLFNTTGPRQTGAYGMVLPTFVRQALDGSNLTVHGNGVQTRCFAHVSDTVRAILLLADTDEAVGEVFNVGAGIEMPIIELARRVIEQTGSDAKIELVPFDEAYGDGFEELGRRKPDTTALTELTGWQPALNVTHAIEDVIAYEQAATEFAAADVALNGSATGNAESNLAIASRFRTTEHTS